MPFPWTKNRVTRFSQIVADLQFQSPKRGRSLVVQTGFPTSLIDLFDKNRNRFKKPRFKKPLRTELPDSPPPPPPPSPVTTPPSITEPTSPYVSPPESPMPSPPTEEITDGAPPVPDRVNERRFVPCTKFVMVKLLTVMILLAIVKGFTVAFTVSAFSLLFLEYAVKRIVTFIRPCSEAIVAMESQFQNVLFQLKTKTKEKNEPATAHDGGVEIELNLNLNSSTSDEIEVVEEKSELEPLDSELKIKGSRSGRFKAKMVKKLISKKFRCSKKEKKMEEEEEKGKESKENEVELISEVSSDGIKNENEIECVRDYEVNSGTTCSEELAVRNSGYRILVIIVLVGLIVGRLPALFLTIVWCFLLKIVKAVWKSHIKSSVPNS